LDENRAAGEVGEVQRLEREKRPVEYDERDRSKRDKDRGLHRHRFPEDRSESQRLEPQRLDVIRQRRATANHDGHEPGADEEPQTDGRTAAGRSP
jgi:hypothetical protein